MKRVYVVLILMITLFVSCATAPTTVSGKTALKVFDESIPLAESATLIIQDGLTVPTYNGMNVPLIKEELVLFGRRNVEFVFPAGYTELLVNLDRDEDDTHYSASNIPVNFDFEAGHRYHILFSYIDDEGKVPEKIYRDTQRALIITDEAQEDKSTPLYFVELNFTNALNSIFGF